MASKDTESSVYYKGTFPNTLLKEVDINPGDFPFSDFHGRSDLENFVVYHMNKNPKGNVVVINNELFSMAERREGTAKDVQNIEATFRPLGFQVIVHNNLNKKEMSETLETESKKNYTDHNCFILFILSHGGNGAVFGIDEHIHDGSNSLKISNIVASFSNNETLLGKPKLFFIQACQGAKKDEGKTLQDEPSSVDNLDNDEAHTIQFEKHSVSGHKSKSKDMNEETTDGRKIPSGADIFLSIAAAEGHVSWRNIENGTWFIQNIAKVFGLYAHKFDLNVLMTLVNNKVSKHETPISQYKQVATTETTLTKLFFFSPRLTDPCVNGQIIRHCLLETNPGSNLSQQVMNIVPQIENLEKELEDKKTEVLLLKDELNNKTGMIEQLETKLKEQTDTILKLTRELKSQKTYNDALTKRYEDEKAAPKILQQDFLDKITQVFYQFQVIMQHCCLDMNGKAESSSKSSDLLQRDTLDLFLVGKTGNGKSATGNTILRRKAFKCVPNTTSVTKTTQSGYSNFHGRVIKVIDGPGVGDTDMNEEEALHCLNDSVQQAIAANPDGYHAFLLVVQFGGRFTNEDIKTIKLLKGVFGDDFIRKYCILVVTHGDSYDPQETDCASFYEWCTTQIGVFKELLEECNNRVVLFDNKTKDEAKLNDQHSRLLSMVDDLTTSEGRYRGKQFQLEQKKREQLFFRESVAIIVEERFRQTILILQQLSKVLVEEPEEQIPQLEDMRDRLEAVLTSIMKDDKGTGVLNELIKNVKNIITSVEKQLTNAHSAIKKKQDIENLRAKREENERALDEEKRKKLECQIALMEEERDHYKVEMQKMAFSQVMLTFKIQRLEKEYRNTKVYRTAEILSMICQSLMDYILPTVIRLFEKSLDHDVVISGFQNVFQLVGK